jgi:hypothetical protein
MENNTGKRLFIEPSRIWLLLLGRKRELLSFWDSKTTAEERFLCHA